MPGYLCMAGWRVLPGLGCEGIAILGNYRKK
jgi:hypothetical protein